MVEIPLFFSNGEYDLFGVLHDPGSISKNFAFIFVHPFAEEKLWAHLVLANFARELAKNGYTVLRFDCMGHGDSDGDFEESTVATGLSDIAAAQQLLKNRYRAINSFGILGLRFGATIAALAAEHLPDVKKLILWEPVTDGAQYMQGLLRSNLATQNAVYKSIIHTREKLILMIQSGEIVNIDGYGITRSIYEQITAINLLDNPVKKFCNDAIIVQINRAGDNANEHFRRLSLCYRKCELRVVNEQPFWKEIKDFYSRADNLFETTNNWLEC